jgi:heptaprenyl diphosphate synthase
VRRRASGARMLLSDLPPVPARAALESLCDLVVSRTS